jgi:hypothetical protein
VDAAQITRMHDEIRRIYTNIINVDQELKRIILESYNSMYTSPLEDYLLQYANRSALEIIMHLKQIYGFINPRQGDGVRCANAGMQPYMEGKYVNIAFLLILNTSAIPDACRDW